jgi:hypothetical protein
MWHSAGRPPEVRGRACAQTAGASNGSCRSGSMCICAREWLVAPPLVPQQEVTELLKITSLIVFIRADNGVSDAYFSLT